MIKKNSFLLLILVICGCQFTPGTKNESSVIVTIESDPTRAESIPTITLTPENTIAPTPISLEGKVSVSSLRVRSEPNTESQLIGGLLYDEKVTVNGMNNSLDWVYVKSTNIIGWTMLAYLNVDGDTNSLPVLTPGNESNMFSSSSIVEDTSGLIDVTATHKPIKTPTSYPTLTKTKIITKTPYPTSIKSIMECRQTYNMVGMQVTCRINRAYCSYQPNVKGNPTFCNDARFPNHSFTLVVWGKDWSGFDGKCLIVKGLVSYYDGRPQIEATTKSQVSYCQ